MSLSTSPSGTSSRAVQLGQTAGYYLAFIALGLVTASLGPTVGRLAARTGTALGEISVLFTARSLGYLLGSFGGGWLYDRIGGHPVVAAMTAVMMATMGATPVVPLLWLLVPLFVLTGVAEGAIDVGGNVLLMWVHGSAVGPYMNALHFFFGVGAFLSPIVIAQIMTAGGGLRWSYWALALLMLPAVVWVLCLPSPRARSPADADGDGRSATLLVVLFVLFFALYVGAEVSFGGWVHTYSVTLGLADETGAAYLTSAFWGALTAGRLLAIPISARVRPRLILLGDLIGALISLSLILLWPRSPAMLWIGALGMGLSLASIFPTMMSLAEREMHVTGQVTGWFLVGASAGSMSVPWLIGQLFEWQGPRVMVVAIGIDLLAAVLLWGVLGIAGQSAGRTAVEAEA